VRIFDCFFKAIVAKEKVSEIVDFEAMQESCIWLTWRINRGEN